MSTLSNLVESSQGLADDLARLRVQACRVCHCTDLDCWHCVVRTGKPCHWVEPDLCSACVTPPPMEPQEIAEGDPSAEKPEHPSDE